MRKILAPAVVMALAFATPALAQTSGGGSGQGGGPTTNYNYQADRGAMKRDTMTNFKRELMSRVELGARGENSLYRRAQPIAECLIKRNDKAHTLVGGMMTKDPEFADLQYDLQKKDKACIARDTAGIPMMVVNGALSEALLLSHDAKYQEKVMPKDIVGAQSFYLRKEGPTIETIGRCMAVFSPGLIVKTLATKPGSKEETEAMTDLYGRTPECGVKTMPKDIPAEAQRAAIATGLYLWSSREG